MKNKIRLAICIVFLFAVPPLFAEDLAMPRLVMPTAASNGFGGHHVAFTDNVYSLFVNPAAMINVRQKSFFSLAPSLINPHVIADLIDPVIEFAKDVENTGALGDAANTLANQKGKIPLGFELREFPFSVAWVADGFGFGIYDRVFINPSIIGTDVLIKAYADLIVPVGFAFKILEHNGHTLDAGVTVKPFARVIVEESANILDLMNEDYDFEEEMKDPGIPLVMGGGIDVGFMYRWDIGLSVGLTFDDIFTRGKVVSNFYGDNPNSYYVPFNLNLGAAYDFRCERFFPNASSFVQGLGFTFAADWHDITNAFQQDDYLNHRNALLDLSLGLQVSIFDKVKIRCGMNEMLPAVGIGLALGAVEIDLAYYGKEFGYEPGMLSTSVVELSIGIRPEAKQRDWPWTRNPIIRTSEPESEPPAAELAAAE